jgi:prepilin-type N-terminal cleavage/methylation domain-containing protein
MVAKRGTMTLRNVFLINSHRSPDGFTLVELLVATTLLCIVMASVYTLTHSSLRTWHLAEGGFDAHLEARNVMTLFNHEYNNIAGRAGHLFEGEEKEICMFVISQPMNLKEGEGRRLMRVIYSYNRNKHTIEREEALVETALPKRPPDGKELDRARIKLARDFKTTVAENVVDFKITYIWAPLPESQNPDEPPVPEPLIYRERHRQLWGLPQAVSIELQIENPDVNDQNYILSTAFPMRAPTVRMRRQQLEEMLSADI